ncbi:MAG TPA: amidohydrolase [Chloroflexi bacterium]|nr:amidohydrolase [Chloroflexota bacterium]HHW85204.1 amidohydrolase [Chloroflexota bacterium]
MQLRDLSPDLILHNAVIYTLASRNPQAQAIAIQDGRIMAVGADAELLPLAGPATRVHNLGGRTVLPGIFDSHNHLLQVGVKLTRIRLDECRSPEEMMELVRARAAVTPPGHWIVGEGWNEGNFSEANPPGRLPTRWDIDPATDQHPVLLMRFFNTDVVNSVALRLAGITRGTPNPPGGEIGRDAAGEPNGLLRAAAKLFVRNLLPQPTLTELKTAIRLGCQEMNRYGITSVLDPGLYPHELAAYQAVVREGQSAQDAGRTAAVPISVRLNVMPSWHGFREEETAAELEARARGLGVASGLGDEWLRLGGLKMAIDGGTSSHTALMYAPFEGETSVGDFNRLDPQTLRRHFRTAQELGWDVGIHTCGDRAMDMVVDAFADVAASTPWPDARHNVIHAYFPSERALAQMAEHRIAAVIQPTFLYWEGDLIFRDVGERRAANYKPARKYLDAGVVLCATSDIPSTVSPDPFVGMYALVTRKNNLGHYVAADQAISREEALRAYTVNGTWLTREEHLKGALAIGKLADLIVIDRNYFTVPEEQIKEIRVLMTMVGGEVVYTASATG